MSRRLTTLLAVSTTMGGLLLTATPALAEPVSDQVVTDVASPQTASAPAESAAPAVAAPVVSPAAPSAAETPAPQEAGESTAPAGGGTAGGTDVVVDEATTAVPEPVEAPTETSDGESPITDAGGATEAVGEDLPAGLPENIASDVAAPVLVEAPAAPVATDATAANLDKVAVPTAVEAALAQALEATESADASTTARAAAAARTDYPTLPEGSEHWDDEKWSDEAFDMVLDWLDENEEALANDKEFFDIFETILGYMLAEDEDALLAYLEEEFGDNQDFAYGLTLLIERALSGEWPGDETDGTGTGDPETPAVPVEPEVPAEPVVNPEPATPPRIEPVATVVTPRAPVAAAAPAELAQTGPDQAIVAAGAGAALLLAGAAMVRLGSRGRRSSPSM